MRPSFFNALTYSRINQQQPSGEPIKLVILDFDGTVADTGRDFYHVMCQLLKKYDKAAIDETVFRKNLASIREMVVFAFGEEHPELARLTVEFEAMYEQHCTMHTKLFDGVCDFLNGLDKQRIGWGFVSNKPTWELQKVATRLGLVARSKFILAAETLEKRKPDPAPLLHACRLERVSVSEAIYVGDMPGDVKAAKAAGMRSVAVSYGYHPDHPVQWPVEHRADHIVDHPSEITMLINACQRSPVQYR